MISLWIDGYKLKRQYTLLDGKMDTDTAIAGGGLVGILY